MLVRTYTINTDGIAPGISTSDYESIVGDCDVATSVRIHLVPVLEKGISSLTVDTAALGVSFLLAEQGECSADGAVISFDPNEWRLCSVDTQLILLDPCGETGRALVYVPGSSGPVLSNVRDCTRYVEVADNGVPVISRRQRSAMLLEAICPGAIAREESAKASSKDAQGSGRRARKAESR